MKRGTIWLINFDPAIGGEIKKTRPAVVVSNNQSNEHLNRVQVIPITSNTEKFYPCEAPLNIEGVKHKAMTDQIITVSKLRCYKKIGVIDTSEIARLEQALKIQLRLL